jgi:hypothetical protein
VAALSFKLGHGGRFADGRTFMDHAKETLRSALAGMGVVLVEAWVTGHVHTERAGERWLKAIAVQAGAAQ